MSEDRISVSELLDDAAGAVLRLAAPWAGVLVLTALPLRFLQAEFALRLGELGGAAGAYGDALRGMASACFVALLPSLAGRAVFVRAVSASWGGEPPAAGATLRVPLAQLVSYVYVAVLLELVFFALAASLFLLPLLFLLPGLAAATSPLHSRPGLFAPLRTLVEMLRYGRALSGLVVCFGLAYAIAAFNLALALQAAFWLAGAIPGVDPADLLRLTETSRFGYVVLIGAGLALEPFWLAALAAYVHRARSRETGADLRAWLDRLSQARAA